QKPGNAPVDVAVLVVDRGASGFRHRGVEQIGPPRRERMHAEEEYQQRRHQRPATHAGETDDGADDKTGEGIEPVHRLVSRSWWKIWRREARGMVGVIKRQGQGRWVSGRGRYGGKLHPVAEALRRPR